MSDEQHKDAQELEERNSELSQASEAPLDPSKDEEEAKQTDLLREIMEWVKMFLLVFLIGICLTTFVIQRNTVAGSSMVPTLRDGDELFVEKVSRYFKQIERGDIITVNTKGLDPMDPNRVIKRVVGMPGELLRIADGSVYINDELLEEPYLPAGSFTRTFGPGDFEIKLDAESYFCLGDNRDGSKDSRHFGPVPLKHVLGKVLVRFYPFDSMGRPK